MDAPRLTLVPFLQNWNPATRELSSHVMVTPVGDPRMPLASLAAGAPAAPSFDSASITLSAHVSTNSGQVPTLADTPASGPTHTLASPPDQTAIFNGLASSLKITQPQQAFKRVADFTLRKYLPESYRQSFDFVAPKTPLAVTDDSYFCALRCPAPEPAPVGSIPDISWGEAYAMLLRQPFLARAAGLIHTVTVELPNPWEGGWLFFDLDEASDFFPQAKFDPTYLKLYSTQVPEMVNADRSVFTSVSFPVAKDAASLAALGPLDEVFDEAISFDDGFSKIVHARQPFTSELPADDGEGSELQTDPGVQLGWDDEDVLIATNRSVGLNADGSTPPEAPSGIAGYRVDVRDAGTTTWNTMCRVAAASSEFNGVALGAFDQETNVEVHPSKIESQFWMPSFFTRWLGRSIIAPTDDEALLSNVERDAPLPFEHVGGDAVPLRYGSAYEFRVRLSDPTGGGPDVTDTAVRPATRPVAHHEMRRKIRMKQVGVEPEISVPDLASTPPTRFTITRPACGYPEAVFTGFGGTFEALRDIAVANQALPEPQRSTVAVPDPDADRLEINIYVETPTFDPAGGRNGQMLLSRTYRPFPALGDLTAEVPLTLDLNWIDAGRLDSHTWPMETFPGATTGPVEVPTARNVRIAVRAVGRSDLTYFTDADAALGDTTDLWPGFACVPASSETTLFEPLDPSDAVVSVFLQPDPVPNAPTRTAPTQLRPSPLLTKRLGSALELPEENGTIFGRPGQRTVFGVTGLKHHLAPDGSSVVITNRSELARIWITALRIPIARDWTWKGYGRPTFEMQRTISLVGTTEVKTEVLSNIEIEHTVNQQAVSILDADRERIGVVAIDAFNPPLDENGFPREASVSYQITANFEAAPSQTLSHTIHLPVATPPKITPTVVSAGHALSPYVATNEYAETLDRERLLWLEFDTDPRQDPRDILYCRPLARSADPMLLPDWEPEADPPQLAAFDIDPEIVRTIRPGQPDDNAGLNAMQPLVPSADSQRHFALPLPSDLAAGSPELFGFFTYEFRIGHPSGTQSAPYWSTAQGRFGPPLQLAGIQFPAPRLECTVRRSLTNWNLSAKHAQSVIDGRPVPLTIPNTQIWFVLYARIMQVDGRTHRNIQIGLKQGAPQPPTRRQHHVRSVASWSEAQIAAALRQLQLPEDTPSSVLAIELLPEPNGDFHDPLQADLGEVRILRASRLIEVLDDCCVT